MNNLLAEYSLILIMMLLIAVLKRLVCVFDIKHSGEIDCVNSLRLASCIFSKNYIYTQVECINIVGVIYI